LIENPLEKIQYTLTKFGAILPDGADQPSTNTQRLLMLLHHILSKVRDPFTCCSPCFATLLNNPPLGPKNCSSYRFDPLDEESSNEFFRGCKGPMNLL
jgi:hypothetical protein